MINAKTFAGRVLIALLMISAFLLLAYALDFVLLVFASILFGVLLSYGANGLNSKLKVKYELAVFVTLAVMFGLLTLVFWLIGPSLSAQIEDMKKVLPESVDSFKDRLSQTSWGSSLLAEVPENPMKIIGNKSDAVSTITGAFSTTIGVIANFAIVLVTGIFLAINPKLYRHGFIRLFPVGYRTRLDGVLIQCYKTLATWLTAKFISMLVVGIATGIGLMLLGVPLPWALALIAFFFAFIPNIGPYVALLPAVLIGLMESPNMALYVVILYFSIQLVESYMLTPIIEKKMVSIPPALMLLWQVLLGTFAGIAGLFLATPILAALMVLVTELYIKDKLEKPAQVIEEV
jgi:predicted PurR-regulated permease PerM